MSSLLPLVGCPVPPMLSEALGYSGGQRYVAFWFDHIHDTACWHDGLYIGAGHWYSWMLWLGHPRVASVTKPFAFGGACSPAVEALVLDRELLRIQAGPIAEAQSFLSKVVRTSMAPVSLMRTVTTEGGCPPLSRDVLMLSRPEQEKLLYDRLAAWLDLHNRRLM